MKVRFIHFSHIVPCWKPLGKVGSTGLGRELDSRVSLLLLYMAMAFAIGLFLGTPTIEERFLIGIGCSVPW